jgi:hypothetical protein
MQNFFALYRPVVDQWRVYDSTREGPPRPVAEGGSSHELIFDPDVWRRFMSEGTL